MMRSLPQKMSIVIIAKNEAKNIRSCLEAARQISDDIWVIVDMESTDETFDIAMSLGVNVIKSRWLGYAGTKNFGNSLTKHEWVFSLDADEIISNDLISCLEKEKLLEKCTYSMSRYNWIGAYKVKFSGWSPDYVRRIFNKKYCQWNEDLVHEQLMCQNLQKQVILKGHLDHFSYQNVESLMSKMDKYAMLKAQQWIKDKKKPPVLKQWFGPSFRFVSTFFLKLGILDGMIGLKIAYCDYKTKKLELYYYKHLINQ